MIGLVTGLHRSGTSLMMQMMREGGIPILTDGGKVRSVWNPHGFCEYSPVWHSFDRPEWVNHAEGKFVKVVPWTFLKYIPANRDYRVLLMVRDPLEVVRSQYLMSAQMRVPIEIEERWTKDKADNIEIALLKRPWFKFMKIQHSELLQGLPATVETFLGVKLNVAKANAAIDPTLYRNRRPEILAARAAEKALQEKAFVT